VSTVLFKFLGTLRMAVDHQSIIYLRCSYTSGGTAAAAPLPFRLGNPVLCGSRPLVTPYYCWLGDLLCFVFMSAYCMFDLSVYYLFLQYFDTVGWVFWPVKTAYNLYCVGGDVKHCSSYTSSVWCWYCSVLFISVISVLTLQGGTKTQIPDIEQILYKLWI